MFGGKKKSSPVSVDKFLSLLAENTEFHGDLEFSDGLKINGFFKGNIAQKRGATGLLALSANGRIEGRVQSHDALIDGTIIGDLQVENLLELHANARVTGNIMYRHLSIENGASIDGKLMKMDTPDSTPRALPAPEMEKPEE